MVGLGTIINTAAILLGGLLGGIFGRFLKDSTQEALTKVCGVSTIFIAISGALPQMEAVENNAMLIVGCLALGALIGELLNIEDGFERFGAWLKEKTGNGKDARFVNAFVYEFDRFIDLADPATYLPSCTFEASITEIGTVVR